MRRTRKAKPTAGQPRRPRRGSTRAASAARSGDHTAPLPRRGNGRRNGTPRPVADPEVQVVAVIDVGSRALRLAIGELAPEQPVRRLEVLAVPIALGLDTLGGGHIRFATTEAVVRTFSDFILVARGYGVEPAGIVAVGTTAVRDARNRDVFLDRVEGGCGLRINVIEAIEETRLVYQFVRHLLGPRFDQGCSLVLSLGAGGTQMILQRDGEILFGETRHFGALQLWGRRGSERTAIMAARRFLKKEVRAIQRFVDLGEARALVVINKELYQLLGSLAKTSQTEAGLDLSIRELQRLHRLLDGLPGEELLARCGLDFPTVEGGRMALEELQAFAGYTSAQRILIPGAAMLDCLLLDAKLRLQGSASGALLARQIESAARALGRKYRFDEAHAVQVRELALQLFDALRGLTHLSDRARLLLGVAALLHDVGYYVSFHHHERHSAYLIESSEIMGLSRQDLERVAMLARFHRRPAATLSTPGLTLLPASERVELLKLAALLRLADALGDNDQQQVERLRLEVSPELLRIYAETRTGDRDAFSSIAESFRSKADLFAEVFGIEPTLTEVIRP